MGKHTEEELAKLAAETRKLNAEAILAEEAARERRANADKAEIERDFLEEKKRWDDASDDSHRIHVFHGVVNAETVKKARADLTRWSRLDPKCDMTIIWNSPGGGVIEGMALFDTISDLRAKGHHVTGIVRGYAASMGGILLQACDRRIIGREAFVMIHEISAGTSGKIGDLKDDVDLYGRMCDRVVDIFLSRAEGKISKATFVKNWTRKDWWLDAVQAVKLGIADEIG